MMTALGARSLGYMSLVGFLWLLALPAAFLAVERQGLPEISLRGLPFLLLGVTALIVGQGLAAAAGGYLTVVGKGTPWPLEPPSILVTSGPYRFVRNPLAIALMLMVSGEVIIVRSRLLWAILPLTFAYLEWMAGPWEDRQLSAAHGELYREYRRRVPKWIPTLSRPGRQPDDSNKLASSDRPMPDGSRPR